MKSRSNQASASSPSSTLPFACDGFSPLAKKLAFVPLIVAGAMSAAADTTGAPAAPTNTAQPPTSPTQAAPTAASANQTASTSTVPAQSASTPAAPTSGKASTSAKKDGKDDVTTLSTVEVSGEKPKELASPKFTQPIVDTPQTVIAIPQEVYEEQGATTLTDVLRNTPGITLAAGEGGSASRTGGDSFYMRGYDTSNSIYIDGVRDEGAVTRDMFDIQQVDVVKGPSPDNGRGGTAGYINLESKTPQLNAFETGTLSYTADGPGADASVRSTLDVNQPLDNKFVPGAAFRLNLMGQDGGVAGRQFAENDRWGVAPSLALGLGTPTRVTLSYIHYEEHNVPDYGLPTGVLPGSGSHYSPGVGSTTYYGFANVDHEDIVEDAVTALVEHDFSPDVKFSNQTRYGRTHRYIEATSPSTKTTSAPGVITLSPAITETTNSIVSNQTNLTAVIETGPFKHTLSSGADLSIENVKSPAWAVSGLPLTESIYDPDNYPDLSAYSVSRTGAYTSTETDTAALYSFDTIDLSKMWQALLGLRLEHYNIDYDSLAAGGPLTSLDTEKTTLSWKTGLVFKPAENGSIYATYSNSFRPPGSSSSANTLSTSATSADNPLLDPQEATNYEVGTKWEFLNKKLLTTLALFQSVNTNVPGTDPVTGEVTQTSDQTVQGIELSATGKITEDWNVFAGYALMNAKVSSILQTASSAGAGSALPLLPTQSGNLWTTYRLPFGLTLGGGAQFMGETARLQAGQASGVGLPSQVPSYWLFNAMASYEVNKHLTLRLNVNNLFGKEYIASINNNGQRFNYGAPRTLIVTAEFAF